MNVFVCDTYAELSRASADVIATLVAEKPDCTLGLATGTTPIGLYDELVADCGAGKISFAQVCTFNLDEYRGLPGDHPQCYRYFMRMHLFERVDIDLSNTHLPDGSNPDGQAECDVYEEAIADAGGIDLQLLGIGHNGHIGFNEPDDSFAAYTHVVDLTDDTIRANSRLFDSIDDVPRQAYTMGIGTIMKAREILLVANGRDKAEIVREALFGPVKPQVPASVLQLHPNVTVVLDKAAAQCL